MQANTVFYGGDAQRPI